MLRIFMKLSIRLTHILGIETLAEGAMYVLPIN